VAQKSKLLYCVNSLLFLSHHVCKASNLRQRERTLTLIQVQPQPCSATQPKNTGYNLRQRTHDLTLFTDINDVIKQNFVYRMLFRDIY